MPIVATRGLTFHVQRLGQGSPVVMIHGLLVGSLASWYFTVAPLLAREHEVFLYDLRGHGRSARAPSGYDLRTMSEDLLALTADYATPLSLVGHSYGGLVALRFAVDHAERVARVVVVDSPSSPASLDATDDFRGFLQKTPEQMIEALPASMKGFVSRGGRQARRLVESLRFLTLESTAMADLRAEPGLSDEELARIDRPVTLFYGDRSACRPAGERYARAIPGAELEVLPGGHYLPTDAPEALGPRLLEVLRG